MTNRLFKALNFEAEFSEWEKNRMYPPKHKGAHMFTVNDSHLKAIARAIHFMRSGLTTQMNQKLIDSVHSDIDRLDEAHKYIRQQINEPGLCIKLDFSNVPTSKESDGRKN